jgi:predicted alpha/beta hydrolase family esterase
MKNAIIFHGAGSAPNDVWYPWLKKELEKKGYKVSAPVLTDDEMAPLDKWLPMALKENYDNETVLVGHSAGCPLILSILENINVKVSKAILVAGFITPLKANTDGYNPILQKTYDWEKIKSHAEEFIFINASNDPWGCDDKQGETMHGELGGTLIINQEGHMGSDAYKQPYKEFPFLLTLMD